MRSRLDQALALAAIGLKIFPIPRLNKEPMADVSWSAMMTTDAAKITDWFTANPDINYGVCPGDDFAVIDLDEKDGKDGVTNFTALNMEQIADDWCLDTFTVRTPSGGKHLYIRVPWAVANSASKIGSGIDIRGARGYVVGPGCVTDERFNDHGKQKQWAGSYTLETEIEIATAPDWLVSKMNQHFERDEEHAAPLIELDLVANVTLARDFLATRAPAIEGSGGDEFTYKTINKLKDFGVSDETAFSLMVEKGGWNSKCEPPWDARELQVKVKNAYTYGQNRAGNKGDLWDAPGAFSPEEYLQGVAEKSESARLGLEAHLYDPLRIVNSREHREMVIPEWLPATGYTALLAARGTGKTVQMMDMACRIATDMDWHDMPIMEDFAVIYICGEDDIGARDQFRAWVIRNQNTIPDADRFYFMDTSFDLMSADSVKQWAEFFYEKLKGRRAVVFIDTWQRATSRGSQNDDVEMQMAVHHAEAFAKSFKGPALIAFHPPKADANVVLGSSVIENSSSAIWTLIQEANGRKLQVTRIKGKGHGNYQIFEYIEVALGDVDVFNREITGVVPERIGGTSTNGSMEEENTANTAKMMYAAAIRDMILAAEKDPAFATVRGHSFTIKDTAQRLMQLPKDDANRQGLEEVVKETFVSETILIRRLTQLFKERGGVYDFDDGVGVLSLDQSTNRPRFKLIAAAKPVVV